MFYNKQTINGKDSDTETPDDLFLSINNRTTEKEIKACH